MPASTRTIHEQLTLLASFDPTSIKDERAREGYILVLNLVEMLKAENERLRAENQQLRDEIQRLKGEQGRPSFPGQGRKAEPRDHSSEQERRQREEKKPLSGARKGPKSVKVDREEVLRVNPAALPADAEFKGYEETVVQDIKITTDNVRFRKEKYYSPSTQKTYLAPPPPGYEGQFGPGIKALVTMLYFACHMTEPKIRTLLQAMNISISAGQVSNLVIKHQEAFHAEKTAVYRAGLESSPWQQSDWTTMRVKGKNHYCHIVCNPLYTAYFTKPSKDRQTILEVLRNRSERTYVLNEQALALLASLGLAESKRRLLQPLVGETVYNHEAFMALLNRQAVVLGPEQLRLVLDATAIAAYHAQREWPIIALLVVDDAPEFKALTEQLALCWVHEGRHYKKLTPFLAHHQRILEAFLSQFWDFYAQLLAYRQRPTPEDKIRLTAAFEALFSQKTPYWELNERLALTKAKQATLLAVLDYPEIPLHNNAAELAARTRVRKRTISYGTHTAEGSQAWDTFMTLAETCKKLGVSFYHYLYDRITASGSMPALADLIRQRTQTANLGRSWQFP